MRDLLRTAKVSRENPDHKGFAKGRFHYRKSEADRRVGELEDPAGLVIEAIEAARREAGPDTETGGILLTRLEDVYLVSSEGPVCQDCRSGIELSIRVFSQREASGHGVECSSTVGRFDPSKAGRKAGEISRLARDPEAGSEGRYDIIFDPLFTGSLLVMWGSMTSAYEVLTHRSIFTDRLGSYSKDFYSSPYELKGY